MNSRSAKLAALLAGSLTALVVPAANGELIINANNSAAGLVERLINGDGFSTMGALLFGVPDQQGTFSGGMSVGGIGGIGIASGVIMSSGLAAAAKGPNTTGGVSNDHNGSSDSDLSGLIGNAPTADANSLSFNFTPMAAGTLRFFYVFASDEYNELAPVGPAQNDVFGLFVSQVNDPQVNVALLPDLAPVSIFNVNCGPARRGDSPPNNSPNCSSFINNDSDSAPYDIQYDGFTKVLTALISVEAGQSYAIKLAIADAGDVSIDSAVFIRGEFEVSGGNGVPEPASMALAGIALLALGAARRRHRHAE